MFAWHLQNSCKTLRQPLLGELAMSRKKEEREKNAIHSYVCSPRAAHALRSDQNAIYSGHLHLCPQPRAAHALRLDQFALLPENGYYLLAQCSI